jgi:hypothetical protein
MARNRKGDRMADRMVLTDVDAIKSVNALARRRGIEPGDALVKMIGVAASRLGATDKYYETKVKGGGKKGKAKAKPTKKAKAKGPLARKVKRAKKAAPAPASQPVVVAQ